MADLNLHRLTTLHLARAESNALQKVVSNVIPASDKSILNILLGRPKISKGTEFGDTTRNIQLNSGQKCFDYHVARNGGEIGSLRII